MKTNTLIRSSILLLTLLCVASLSAAENFTRYKAKPGSKVKIEGSSNIHDWVVETGLIGGTLDIDTNFPLDPAKNPPAGKVAAKVSTFIMVSSIKSGKKSMDNIMHDTMKRKANPKISYKLQDLVFKKVEKSELLFEAKGVLTVSGVAVTNTMPVVMIPQPNDKLIIKGTVNLKMTDFGMKPPAPAVGLGLIKTADAVKVSFEWNTAKAK